jgi:hypothetical protein
MTDPDLRDPRLDRAYRGLPGDEPPPEVDERIRAAARRAVGAKPQSLEARPRSWASRWRVPLSLAASVVVVVTLTLMMQEEEHRALQGEPMPAPSPAAPATLEDRAAPSRAPEEVKRADTEPARGAPVPAPLQRAPAADAVAPPPPQLEKLETRQQVREEPKAAGAPSSPATAPAPAAAPSGMPPSLSRERAVSERPAREMRSAPLVARSPEEWLEEIRRLKAQGRDADAAAELAEFRRRHPEYPLPVDLAR